MSRCLDCGRTAKQHQLGIVRVKCPSEWGRYEGGEAPQQEADPAKADWRPIETLDVERWEMFFGWNKTNGVMACTKSRDGSVYQVLPHGDRLRVRPTHWQPRPDPPDTPDA